MNFGGRWGLDQKNPEIEPLILKMPVTFDNIKSGMKIVE